MIGGKRKASSAGVSSFSLFKSPNDQPGRRKAIEQALKLKSENERKFSRRQSTDRADGAPNVNGYDEDAGHPDSQMDRQRHMQEARAFLLSRDRSWLVPVRSQSLHNPPLDHQRKEYEPASTAISQGLHPVSSYWAAQRKTPATKYPGLSSAGHLFTVSSEASMIGWAEEDDDAEQEDEIALLGPRSARWKSQPQAHASLATRQHQPSDEIVAGRPVPKTCGSDHSSIHSVSPRVKSSPTKQDQPNQTPQHSTNAYDVVNERETGQARQSGSYNKEEDADPRRRFGSCPPACGAPTQSLDEELVLTPIPGLPEDLIERESQKTRQDEHQLEVEHGQLEPPPQIITEDLQALEAEFREAEAALRNQMQGVLFGREQATPVAQSLTTDDMWDS